MLNVCHFLHRFMKSGLETHSKSSTVLLEQGAATVLTGKAGIDK